MLRGFGTLLLSGLVFLGLAAVWFAVLVLALDVAGVRAARAWVSEDVWIWGGATIAFVIWMVPALLAHKRIMKRLKVRFDPAPRELETIRLG